MERASGRYTQSYQQPESYHFCLETVIAAEHIATQVSPPQWIADVGAGCGVFGLELLHHFQDANLDAFELQNEFQYYFELNKAVSPHPERVSLHLGDIRKTAAQFLKRFDLIVANIPFFEPTESKLSTDSLKNNCRFLLNGSASEFLAMIDLMLIENGSAFVLCRPEPLQRALIPADLQILVRTEIRDSLLVQYKKQRPTRFSE